MSIQVTLKATEPTTVAFIPRMGSYSQIPQTMTQLMRWVTANGYRAEGPPSGVYFNNPMVTPEAELTWEIRVPLAGKPRELSPSGGVGIKTVSAGEIAAAIHRGPYAQVGNTYQELGRWLGEQGYRVAGPAEEVYLSDPSTTPEAELMTEIRMPVAKA